MTFSTIGTLYKKTGNTFENQDGILEDELEMICDTDGEPFYHVNVLGSDERVAPYIVEVATPSRKFSGRSDTVCLRFKNRDEWLALEIETVEEMI